MPGSELLRKTAPREQQGQRTPEDAQEGVQEGRVCLKEGFPPAGPAPAGPGKDGRSEGPGASAIP